MSPVFVQVQTGFPFSVGNLYGQLESCADSVETIWSISSPKVFGNSTLADNEANFLFHS